MCRFLIVDDDKRYREELACALDLDEKRVRTAGSGQEAIEIGVRFKPRVLIVDWILKCNIHGLHVADTLQAVYPALQTILIANFASKDLREQASKMRIFDFIEKPFGCERFREACARACDDYEPNSPAKPQIGLLELDSDNNVVSANSKAQQLIDCVAKGREITNLSDLFNDGAIPNLDDAVGCWLLATPENTNGISWMMRSQHKPAGETRLVIVRDKSKPWTVSRAQVDILLGSRSDDFEYWPSESRVMVIEEDAVLRDCLTSMFDFVGAGCYAAASIAEAICLLQSDEGLKHVIYDMDLAEPNLHAVSRQIRALRPDVEIIGTSGADRSLEAARHGIRLFLQKPWRIRELTKLLQQNL